MLDEEVVGNESVLAELNLDSYAIFDQISLVVRHDRRITGLLDDFLLFVVGQVVETSQEFFIGRDVKCVASLVPAVTLEPDFEGVVQVGRRVQEPTRHGLFSRDLGAASLGINLCDDLLRFIPEFLVMDHEEFEAVQMGVGCFDLHQ